MLNLGILSKVRDCHGFFLTIILPGKINLFFLILIQKAIQNKYIVGINNVRVGMVICSEEEIHPFHNFLLAMIFLPKALTQ